MAKKPETLEALISELQDNLEVDGHPGGPGFGDWLAERNRVIREYMEAVYDLGRERGAAQELNYWIPL